MVACIGKKHRRKYSLYFLRCPQTGRVRYIGITSDEKARKDCHTRKNSELEHDNPRKKYWVEWLRSKKLKPIFEVKLSGLSWHHAIAAEKRLLLLYHTFTPWQLVNKNVYEISPVPNGGIGIFRRTFRKVGQHLDFYA